MLVLGLTAALALPAAAFASPVPSSAGQGAVLRGSVPEEDAGGDGVPVELPAWFSDWLQGPEGWVAEEHGEHAVELVEALSEARLRIALALEPGREEGLLGRLRDARAGAAAASAARRSAEAAVVDLSDEMDRLMLARAAALSEQRPSDARTPALLEGRIVVVAPLLASAQSHAESARQQDVRAAAALRRAERAHADHLSERSEAAYRYAELVFGAASELSGRSWGYGSALPCPLFAPPGTLRLAPSARDPDAAAHPGPHLPDAPPEPLGQHEDFWLPVFDLCVRSSAAAPTAEAAEAVRYAFNVLGAPYACDGVGRTWVFRFDCSSFVSRAFSEGAGMAFTTVSWAPSTRDMVPWDGHRLASWVTHLDRSDVLPGDLWLFDTGLAASRHVVMLLADGLMVHTNRCGDVLHITWSWADDLPSGVVDLGPRRADFEGWAPPEVPDAGAPDLSDASSRVFRDTGEE